MKPYLDPHPPWPCESLLQPPDNWSWRQQFCDEHLCFEFTFIVIPIDWSTTHGVDNYRLAATCVRILRYTFGVITGLDELRDRLSNVEVDVNALRAEVELIRAAVEELRVWLNNNPPQEREETL